MTSRIIKSFITCSWVVNGFGCNQKKSKSFFWKTFFNLCIYFAYKISFSNNSSLFQFNQNSFSFVVLKGATELYFTHYSCVVIILFNSGLYKSAFFTDSFGKLVFLCTFCVFYLFCVELDAIFINFIIFAWSMFM